MKNFAWSPARSVAEAAAAASSLVADAMIAPADAGASIVKAGGVDIVDLMKEGLLAPARIVGLRGRARPRRDRGRRRRLLAHRRHDDAEPARRARRRARAFPRADGRGREFREPANPQCRDLGRQSAATAALLVFPRRGLPLPAQGRRTLLRDLRREPISRDLRQPSLRHRPSLDRGDGAGRARRLGRTRRRRRGQARSSRSRISLFRRIATCSARTT